MFPNPLTCTTYRLFADMVMISRPSGRDINSHRTSTLPTQSGKGGEYTIVDAESAILCFAYKRMLPERKLSDYLGRNEKTKVRFLPDLLQWFPKELNCNSGNTLGGCLAYLRTGTLLSSPLRITGNCASSEI